MAGATAVSAERELRRQVLLARCELDRQELSAEVSALRGHIHDRVRSVTRATPWLLLAAPLGGLLVARLLRPKRLAGLLVLTRLAFSLRPWWPVIADLLKSRATGAKPPGV